MSEAKEFCLLVSRGGSTKIWKLSTTGLRFGYAPPSPTDLTLYDGTLHDIHGAIEYDTEATIPNASADSEMPTKYRLRVFAPGIRLDDQLLPPRETIAVQLRTGNQINVGKYVLTVAEYQPTSNMIEATGQESMVVWARPATDHPVADLTPYLGHTSRLFLQYLPELYQPEQYHSDTVSTFLSRFLALFESEYFPVTWDIDNFDLFLHPDSAPPAFLPWLARWYGVTFDQQQLTIAKQRELLKQLPNLVARKGTVAGLSELLWLYTGQKPKIIEHITEVSDENRRFRVNAESRFRVVFDPELGMSMKKIVLQLINMFKPAHASLDPQDGWQS